MIIKKQAVSIMIACFKPDSADLQSVRIILEKQFKTRFSN